MPKVPFQEINNSNTDFCITQLTPSRQNTNVHKSLATPTMMKKMIYGLPIRFAHIIPIHNNYALLSKIISS